MQDVWNMQLSFKLGSRGWRHDAHVYLCWLSLSCDCTCMVAFLCAYSLYYGCVCTVVSQHIAHLSLLTSLRLTRWGQRIEGRTKWRPQSEPRDCWLLTIRILWRGCQCWCGFLLVLLLFYHVDYVGLFVVCAFPNPWIPPGALSVYMFRLTARS